LIPAVGAIICLLILVAIAASIEQRPEVERPSVSFDDEMGAGSDVLLEASPEKVQAFTEIVAGFDWHVRTLPATFFREYYDEFGPEAMIAVLDDVEFCHSEAHNLGRVIYERTQDLAVATNICRNQCSSGCIHGVLMGLFAQKSDSIAFADSERHATIEDLTPALQDEILGVCEGGEVTRHIGIGNCYHAIGHALMALANFDIPSATGLCELFEKHSLGAIYNCVTGIYMERDIEYGAADALVSNVYPCAQNEHPVACYRYKMRRVFDLDTGHEAAIALCQRLSGAERRGCFHGVGFGSAKRIYKDPDMADDVCASGDETDQLMCLEGAFGYTNLYDHSVAEEACEAYAGNKAICFAASPVKNFRMDYDFDRYLE